MKTSSLIAVAAAAALGLGATGATAASSRAWVSGHGVDQAGCGAPTAPCRSLQYAHDNALGDGGEIDILDPAGYGAITITKSISIVNDGVGTAGVQATSGNAITINAPPGDTVYLRGLNLDGVQQHGGNGVFFSSGGRLTIVGCVIRHFNSSGIFLAPTANTAQFSISNSISSDNGEFGLVYDPLSGSAVASGEVDHLITNSNNVAGAYVNSFSESGAVNFAFSDLISTNNGGQGLGLTGGNLTATVSSALLALNAQNGLVVLDAATAHVSSSVINQNGNDGIDNLTTTGVIFTTGNNEVEANVTHNVDGTLPTSEALR